jgi:hypothetical protein
MTPFTIQFHSHPATEVLRLTKDGIWANPDIPVDDAAKLVLDAIDHNIKILVQKAVLAEREACAAYFVPDALTGQDPETPEYREGWNDCRAFMLNWRNNP